MVPVKRDIYAVHQGDYAGEMWIWCTTDDSVYKFLAVPVMENRECTKEKFDIGIKENIIKKVEKIPKGVFEVSLAQFNKNEDDSFNSRRSESHT